MPFSPRRVAAFYVADQVEVVGPSRLCVNLAKLCEVLGQPPSELEEAFYYRSPKNFPTAFRKVVERTEFKIRNTCGNPSTSLAADAVAWASKVDVIVLFAGTGDLEQAIKQCQAQQAEVEVWIWRDAIASRVRHLANVFVALDELDIVLK